MRGLEERASRLEIEPDKEDVEEYRTITDDAWPSYLRGAIRKGSQLQHRESRSYYGVRV